MFKKLANMTPQQYGLIADAFSALGGRSTNYGQLGLAFEEEDRKKQREKMLKALLGGPTNLLGVPTANTTITPRIQTPSGLEELVKLPEIKYNAPTVTGAPTVQNVSPLGNLTPGQRQIASILPTDQALGYLLKEGFKTYSGKPVQIQYQGRVFNFAEDDPQLLRYLNAGAVQLKDGINPKTEKQFQFEEKLSKQYTIEPNVKNYRGIRDAYDRLNSAYTIQTNSPEARAQADLSMVIAYMKMLDPGSVVREGEQEMARQTAGISDQLFNTYNKVKTGEFLTEAQRAGFMLNAQQIRQDVEINLASTNTSYQDRAKRYGVNPSFILSPKEYEEIGLSNMTPPPEAWLKQKPPEIDPDTWAATWLRLTPEKRKQFEQ